MDSVCIKLKTNQSYKIDIKTIGKLIVEWTKSMVDKKFFDIDPDMLCSFDVTYTNHRSDTHTTISPSAINNQMTRFAVGA